MEYANLIMPPNYPVRPVASPQIWPVTLEEEDAVRSSGRGHVVYTRMEWLQSLFIRGPIYTLISTFWLWKTILVGDRGKVVPLVAVSSLFSNNETTRQSHRQPKIAWCLSFPNSGTTFTMQSVRQLSNRTIAANACLSWVHEHCERIAVATAAKAKTARDDDDDTAQGLDSDIAISNHRQYSDMGPYRISKLEDVPEKYLLTRTHCAGHWPFRHKVDAITFAQACHETAQVHAFLAMKSHQHSYHAHVVVEKVIHLWRHPWDNVVARFHHVKRYVPRLLDLASYCRAMDVMAWRPNQHAKRNNSTTTASGLICRSELDRYLQWHENALHMEQANENTMSVLHVKYEDYAHVDTLKRILKFLHLDQLRNLNVPFEPNKTYVNLLSHEQMHSIALYLKDHATPRVWEKIAAYF